ncbi:hypothetical protein HMPREF1544_01165 [Mucor circinelloides 1006PhL]|uniref:CUE domain-containing protein n=1 Tax=Mucor circinelloides f. circinelloides (strain 1006PhL) TaxID=1220926 RepID=S2JTY1_MUCC1|nr:hypothetical protein HMPREF1544_01165 [Mucor circinelloides 1006PhL]
MSEPQNKPVDELMKPATPSTAEQVNQEQQVPITLPASENENNTTELTGDVKTLKDAFPDLDVDVIETILASQGGNLDAAFEVLLGMSDPSYKPEPGQSEGMNQLRQDEEYARRLAREGDAHYPQNNAQQQQQQQQAEQPLFNFQEELPIIKEKVIEAGTAAKNKIMSLYNQFMAPDQTQQQQGQSSQGGMLETGMGNLSLSDNQAPPPPQARQQYTASPPPQQQSRPSQPTPTSRGSVDLYEWDGNKTQQQSPVRNPLLSQRKESVTSTSAEQLLSDEEFARQLAREDAEASSRVATPNTITTPPPATTTPTADTTTAATANAPTTTTTTASQHAKSGASSDNEEVTFSALDNEAEKATKPGYTHTANDDDDLDDLFDKQDSNLDLSVESIDSVDKEASKTSSKK